MLTTDLIYLHIWENSYSFEILARISLLVYVYGSLMMHDVVWLRLGFWYLGRHIPRYHMSVTYPVLGRDTRI